MDPELRDCLRRLYGGDKIDRLEAAPEFGRGEVRPFDDVLAELEKLPYGGSVVIARRPVTDLTYELDPAEQARFEAECERDLRGDRDE